MSGLIRRFGMLLALVGASLTTPVFAASPEEARVFIEERMGQVLTIIKTPDEEGDRVSAFKGVLEQTLDMESISRFMLARHWRTMSDTQKADFISAYSDYISRRFTGEFGNYTDETVAIGSVRDLGRKGTLVSVKVEGPRTPLISMDWLVSDRSGTLRAADLLIEGQSLLLTEKPQVQSMVNARGGDINAVIADMRQRKG